MDKITPSMMARDSNLDTPEIIFINLVTAIISVNNWAIHKSCAIQEGLSKASLLDLAALREMSVNDISSRLLAAGYERPEYVRSLVATRLHALARALDATRFGALCESVQRKDSAALDAQLPLLPGVGSSVLRTFKDLEQLR